MALSIREIRNYPFSAWRQIVGGLEGSRSAAWFTYRAFRALADDLQAPSSHAEQLMAKHARTFRFATRFLPAEYRADTIQLYCFFRTVDDLVDESGTDRESRRAAGIEIDAWERWMLDGMRSAAPDHSLGERLARVVRQSDIPVYLLLDFLAGMRRDIELEEFETRSAVEQYSYQVASTVGLSMAHIFRAVHPEPLDAARSLGIAMQLTNILRDIGGDLARKRLYLPRDVLESHNLSRSEIEDMWRSGSKPDERLRGVMREMVVWADNYYSEGVRGISYLPPDVRLPILISARLYQRILRELENNGYDSLQTRVYTNGGRKALELYRCAYLNRESFWHAPATSRVAPGTSRHAR
jgi:15-cis-phytoene synthase